MRFFKYSGKPEGTENEPKNEKVRRESKGFSSFGAKIVCLVAAIIVWFYVSGEQSVTYEKEFQGVEIKYSMGTLTEKGYSIISGKNATVNVTVTGTRREVNSMSSEDIIARADLSKIKTAGEYPVEIKVTAPGNTNVKTVYPHELNVYIDTPIKKSFRVETDIHNLSMSDSTLKMKKPILSVDEVWVTGPEEEVNKIACAMVDLDFSGDRVSDSITKRGIAIKLVDFEGKEYSNSYVELDRSETDVDIIVNKQITVPVRPKYSGGFSAKNAGYSEETDPSEISIRGVPGVISGIEYIETTEINADEISGTVYGTEVSLSIPSGVETDVDTDSVSVTLRRTNGKTEVETSNILLINGKKELEFSADAESIGVTFSGNLADIDKLSGENVYLIADLSGISSEGEYKNVKLRPLVFGMDVIENGRVKVEGVYSCTITAKKTDKPEVENSKVG